MAEHALRLDDTMGGLSGRYDGLRVTCLRCRKVEQLRFHTLAQRHGVKALDTVELVATRLVCRACRLRVGALSSLAPWRIGG